LPRRTFPDMDARTSRFVADTTLVTRRIGDETILVPIASRVGDLDSIYTLTEVGSRIWSLLVESPVTVDQIAVVICAEYNVSHSVAAEDAREFVEALVSGRLAHPVAEPPVAGREA
jgi:hypothetical protein